MLPGKISLDKIDYNYSYVADTGYAVYGGYIDEALIKTSVANMRTYHLSSDTFTFPVWQDEQIISKTKTENGLICFVFPNSIVNNPLVYLPQVIAYSIGSLFFNNAYILILCMRLGSLIFYVLGVLLAIRVAPLGKRTIAILSLMPNSLATNAMVTADVYSHVITALFIACLIKIIVEDTVTRRYLGLTISTCLLMAACKTTYLPIVFLSFLVPLLTRKGERMLCGHPMLLFVSLPFAAIALALIWYSIVNGINTGIMFKADVFPEQQVALVLAQPLNFLKVAFLDIASKDILGIGDCGVLSWRLELSTISWIAITGIVLAIAFDLKDAKRSHPDHLSPSPKLAIVALTGTFCVLISSALLIELALYVQFTALGSSSMEGVQDRYFMPLTITALALLNLAVCIHTNTNQAVKAHRVRTPASALTPATTIISGDNHKIASGCFFFAACLTNLFSVYSILAQFV